MIPPPVHTPSLRNSYSSRSTFKTPKLTELIKAENVKKEIPIEQTFVVAEDEPFTEEELLTLWKEFAEGRKIYQAEYHLLSQPFTRRENNIIIDLHNPVEESLLSHFKSDLTAYLREKLKNNSITVTGELKTEADKKIIYTNREKFEYLIGKNPILKELKERLGLDVDF